jgi:O-antigen/teichoic acid export membrane protein
MSIRRYASYNLVAAVAPILVSFATVPLYLEAIGLERYGVLAICWVLVGYFGLFEFGLGPATSQRIAALADAPANEKSQTIWCALLLSLGLGILGGCLVYVFGGPLLTAIRSIESSLADELNRAIPWLAVLIPLTTSYGVLSGALQGSNRFKVMNLIGATGNVVVGVAPLLVAVLVGPQLPNLLETVVVGRGLTVAMLLMCCWRSVPMSVPALPSWARIESLAVFGGWVTATAIVVPILMGAEKLAIGWMAGATAVSIYMIPYNLISRLLVIPQSLASALFPRFALIPEHEVDATEYRALRSLSAILTPILVAGLAALPPFLDLWVGANIGQQSWPIGTVLIAGIWFNCCSFIPHSRLQGGGRPDVVTKISIGQLLPYLLAVYVAIRLAGPIGAAAVWSVRVAVEMFIFFAATGQPQRLLSTVLPPGALVLASAAAALLAPFPSAVGIATQIVLLALAIGIAIIRLRKEFPSWRISPMDQVSPI